MDVISLFLLLLFWWMIVSALFVVGVLAFTTCLLELIEPIILQEAWQMAYQAMLSTYVRVYRTSCIPIHQAIHNLLTQCCNIFYRTQMRCGAVSEEDDDSCIDGVVLDTLLDSQPSVIVKIQDEDDDTVEDEVGSQPATTPQSLSLSCFSFAEHDNAPANSTYGRTENLARCNYVELDMASSSRSMKLTTENAGEKKEDEQYNSDDSWNI
jgi:hypothetical protein